MNEPIHKSITGSRAVEIARSVERAVREGRLRPGARLPSVRGLARRLGVSPTTVAAAYRSLRGRGVLLAAGRRGTRVAEGPALRRIEAAHHLYGEPHPVPELLRLVARDFAADGIPAEAPLAVSGALDGLERLLEAWLRPGDRIAVEDPGFTSVLDLCAARGLAPVPVEVDDEGPLPASLAEALAAGAEAFVLTPRAQNPTGAALTPARERALRAVLRAHRGALVIEDDHAGAIAGAPARTLCDPRRERWAVLRSLSKALGPDLRLAFLCADATTLARVEGAQRIAFRWVSMLLQATARELLRDAAAVRRAARTYAQRREALRRALEASGVASRGRSGLNVWVPVPEEGAVAQ